MASILRQIVAGPRARHPEARLDLCYVTDNIIVTSGPSSVWPKKAYRNPTDQLVAFLDKKHGKDWAVFEFRAEGTGYPDSEVYNRIHHFPWPDHHPPPFAIIPNLMAAMRNWLQENKDRVAVVHCKAGKGRSGTGSCAYLISEEGWKQDDALQRFTERRMRAGFGHGVSIPSQLRWIRYVDRWVNSMNKQYAERPVEVLEVHLLGLRDGVKVGVEGFLEEGKRIHCFHTFTREEKTIVDGPGDRNKTASTNTTKNNQETLTSPIEATPLSSKTNLEEEASKQDFQDVILKPTAPIQLPTSDMSIDTERRNPVKYTGYTMVTSLAHVWFNAWFEGGYEGSDSGVFEIDWEAMDGIKGSAKKGIKAFDKMKVVWRYTKDAVPEVILEPAQGEPVKEGEAAHWAGQDPEKEKEAKHSDGVDSSRAGGAPVTMGTMVAQGAETLGKELGLRKSKPESANVSLAGSTRPSSPNPPSTEDSSSTEVKSAEDVEHLTAIRSDELRHDQETVSGQKAENSGDKKADTSIGRGFEQGLDKTAQALSHVKWSDTAHDNESEAKGKAE